jgi:hypothetical protein
MRLKVCPLVDTSHWTVGAGVPEAAAVKDAVDPTVTESAAGCAVMVGGTGLVRAAGTPGWAWNLFLLTMRSGVPTTRSVSMSRAAPWTVEAPAASVDVDAAAAVVKNPPASAAQVAIRLILDIDILPVEAPATRRVDAESIS